MKVENIIPRTLFDSYTLLVVTSYICCYIIVVDLKKTKELCNMKLRLATMDID